jgi:hypothetical protein
MNYLSEPETINMAAFLYGVSTRVNPNTLLSRPLDNILPGCILGTVCVELTGYINDRWVPEKFRGCLPILFGAGAIYTFYQNYCKNEPNTNEPDYFVRIKFVSHNLRFNVKIPYILSIET